MKIFKKLATALLISTCMIGTFKASTQAAITAYAPKTVKYIYYKEDGKTVSSTLDYTYSYKAVKGRKLTGTYILKIDKRSAENPSSTFILYDKKGNKIQDGWNDGINSATRKYDKHGICTTTIQVTKEKGKEVFKDSPKYKYNKKKQVVSSVNTYNGKKNKEYRTFYTSGKAKGKSKSYVLKYTDPKTKKTKVLQNQTFKYSFDKYGNITKSTTYSKGKVQTVVKTTWKKYTLK